MKLPWFDINKLLMCPCCHKSEGLALVWSGGDNHRGRHEDDFVCGLCNCEFTAVYKIEGINITEEGEKTNG